MSPDPITESDLHAYLDGQLSASRRSAVEAYLAAHPDEAERLHAYRSQQRELRQRFDPVLDETIPPALRNLARQPTVAVARRHHPTRWSLQRLAAGLLIGVLGGAVGWQANQHFGPAELRAQAIPLARQAAIAHVVFSPDIRRPVEIGAEHEDQLVTWLSKRLGTSIRPPKLAPLGYELIGGRLLPGNSGPVAQFMYHDASGQRLTLYVSTENAGSRDTAFRFAQEGPVNVFYWIDGKFGYALSAGIDKAEMARVATAVYEQLEQNSAPQPRQEASHEK
jgi:anti-sigma factor RsiW